MWKNILRDTKNHFERWIFQYNTEFCIHSLMLLCVCVHCVDLLRQHWWASLLVQKSCWRIFSAVWRWASLPWFSLSVWSTAAFWDICWHGNSSSPFLRLLHHMWVKFTPLCQLFPIPFCIILFTEMCKRLWHKLLSLCFSCELSTLCIWKRLVLFINFWCICFVWCRRTHRCPASQQNSPAKNPRPSSQRACLSPPAVRSISKTLIFTPMGEFLFHFVYVCCRNRRHAVWSAPSSVFSVL